MKCEMTLSEALKTMSKRSKLPYQKWGKMVGNDTYSVITTQIYRNDAHVSTLVRLANAAGYDVLLVRRHALEPEEPIVIENAGKKEGSI